MFAIKTNGTSLSRASALLRLFPKLFYLNYFIYILQPSYEVVGISSLHRIKLTFTEVKKIVQRHTPGIFHRRSGPQLMEKWFFSEHSCLSNSKPPTGKCLEVKSSSVKLNKEAIRLRQLWCHGTYIQQKQTRFEVYKCLDSKSKPKDETVINSN